MSTRKDKTFRRKEERDFDRWFDAETFNILLEEFNNPDTYKSYDTVEELFADLDKT